MDAFRTQIPAPQYPFAIHHASNLMLMGSCFSENIGTRLIKNKLRVCANPFGILFNPFSIMNALERMLNNRPYQETELIQVGDHFVSLDHHGKFNKPTAAETLESINKKLEEGRNALLAADVVFITLGSAWTHRHVALDHMVANCHKIPNNAFEKKLLSFQEVHLILRHIPEFFAAKKMKAEIVFTVSPVRHWKDGPIQNQRSKSILNAAIHEVCDEYKTCHYFPSYEYVMDDLRDYRFYGSDMLHPTEQAVDYIWEKFQTSFFNDETRIVCKEVCAIVDAASHRPMDPESNSFQRFARKQLNLIEGLNAKYPLLDLESERVHFSSLVLS